MLLFLAVMGAMGILTFIFATPTRGGGALSVAEVRRALLEAVGVGTVTALYLGYWRRQWGRTLIALFLGAAVLCWLAFAPDRLMQPSGAVLLTLVYIGVPLLTVVGMWRRIRR